MTFWLTQLIIIVVPSVCMAISDKFKRSVWKGNGRHLIKRDDDVESRDFNRGIV
jgi:hypothetical protein